MSNLKQKLKHSFVGKTLYKVRDFYRFPEEMKVINKIKNNDDIVLLLGVSTFNNLGDHLISLASVEFIHDIYPNKKIIEIPTQFYLSKKDELIKCVSSSTPIFIVGGGWMGNIWEDDEYRMQDMIKSFHNNKIIILPQTVFYDLDMDNAEKVLNSAIKTYECCKELTMFFREQMSYDFAKKHFGIIKHVKIFLMPDIVLYYNYSSNKEKNSTLITTCLRKDREQMQKLDINKLIKNYCKKNDYNFSTTDTVTKYSIPLWRRERVLLKKLNEFYNSTIIVTDRLHGMIFATLTKTKCIVFDNKTKKVSGVYKLWLAKNNQIVFLNDNITEKKLLENLEDLLNFDEFNELWNEELKINFEQMKKQINKKG